MWQALEAAGWLRWSPEHTVTIVLLAVRPEPQPEARVIDDVEAAWATGSRIGVEEPDPGMDPSLWQFGAAWRRTRLLDLAAPLGITRLDTVADTVEFLVAVGVLHRVWRDGQACLAPARCVPLPEDRLALPPEERRVEDHLRWRELFADLCSDLLSLFRPDAADRPDSMRASLNDLARQRSTTAEDIREAVQILVDDGLVTVDADVARLEADRPFDLVMNWEAIDRVW